MSQDKERSGSSTKAFMRLLSDQQITSYAEARPNL